MTATRPSTVLEIDACIVDRYRVLEVLDSDVWGATYVVEDATSPGLRLVMKQIRIPPLRAGLEERLDLFGAALTRLHQLRHPALAPVVDFFNDSATLYVVSERVGGADLAALLAAEKLPRDAPDVVRIALHVADGLKALLRVGQHQAVSAFGPRHVMLLGKGRAALVNFGVGQFLRPFATAWKPPENLPGTKPAAFVAETRMFEQGFQHQAVRRVGQLLYTLITHRTWSESAVIVAEGLPEGHGPLMMRALRAGTDGGYDDLDAVIRDLSLLHNVQKIEAYPWAVSATPPPPPPWETMGVGAFAVRSSIIGMRHLGNRFTAQRRFAIALQVLLAVSLLSLWWVHRDGVERARPYVKSGSAVYVTCANGQLQTWDARAYTRIWSQTLESPAGPLAWSRLEACVLVGLPKRKRLVAYDARDNTPRGSVTLQAGCGDIIVSADGRLAFCSGTPASLLSGVDLQSMRGTRIVPLAGHGLALSFGPDGHSVLAATDGPPRVTLHDSASGAVLSQIDVSEPVHAIRVSPEKTEVWLVGSSTVTVCDAAMALKRAVPMGGNVPVDVGWSEGAPYVLWRSAVDGRGGISRVEGGELDPNSTVPTGPSPDHLAVLPDHVAWVSIPGARTLQVFDLPQRRLKANLVLEAPVNALQWIP